MSNSIFKQNIIKIVATTALTFGLVGTSLAANGKQDSNRSWNGLWVPGYGMVSSQTVDSLKLNDKQTQLLQEAKDFSKDIRQKHTKNSKQNQAENKKDKQIINPHAANDKMLLRQESANKWLALWDSLDNDQKQIVSDAVTSNKGKKRNSKDGRKYKDQSKFKHEHRKNHKHGDKKQHRQNS